MGLFNCLVLAGIMSCCAAGASASSEEPRGGKAGDPLMPIIAFAQNDPTNTSSFFVFVTFGAPVLPILDEAALSVVNGNLTSVTATSDTTFELTVVPQADGLVEVVFAAGAAQDSQGNPSLAASASIRFDSTPAHASLLRGSPQFVNAGPVLVELSFDEPVYGVTTESVLGTNATVSLVSGVDGDQAYIYEVMPLAEGSFGMRFLSGGALDEAGNGSTAVGPLEFALDITPPDAELELLIGETLTSQNPVPLALSFSEPVTGFDPGLILLSNATLVGNPVLEDGGQLVHFEVAPQSNGTVTVQAGAGSAVDRATNPALASQNVGFEYEGSQPAVTIDQSPGQADPALSLPIYYDITFSEPVVGLENYEIKQNGTAAGLVFELTALTDVNYQLAVLSALRDGYIDLSIEAGVAEDIAGNLNLRSTSNDSQVLLDRAAPTLQLIGPTTITLTCGTPFTEPGYRANDNVDGNLTAQVVVDGAVLPEVEGAYELTYNVSDTAGHPAEPRTRTVHVVLEAGCGPIHSADTNEDGDIELSELLRVIQFFNAHGYHCDGASGDGYSPGTGPGVCRPHSADYLPQDWTINISELLRTIQFFTMGAYHRCSSAGTEDGFCTPQEGAKAAKPASIGVDAANDSPSAWARVLL